MSEVFVFKLDCAINSRLKEINHKKKNDYLDSDVPILIIEPIAKLNYGFFLLIYYLMTSYYYRFRITIHHFLFHFVNLIMKQKRIENNIYLTNLNNNTAIKVKRETKLITRNNSLTFDSLTPNTSENYNAIDFCLNKNII